MEDELTPQEKEQVRKIRFSAELRDRMKEARLRSFRALSRRLAEGNDPVEDAYRKAVREAIKIERGMSQ